ncbi:GGDEF domain-containing protein [Georgenia sp. TF02-10]|uniref:GGDEF domain-containing protein n=1 Tax=Georgenia sp. TF02-10 TaxID=2917725 RepID=UPI001FA7C30E|nr:GGDEF domain-containing protein [Georgenia sp. TF02-10]UNX55347.1 GGDEF domain-containing protein [Georgenia sp. TF02-10]
MSLDLPSLLTFSTVVILGVSVVFVLESWDRTERRDRWWTTAFAAAPATALASLASVLAPEERWPIALANGSFVLIGFALWTGLRLTQGRSAMVPVTLGATALATLAPFVPLRADGAWAGGEVYLAGVATGTLLAAAEILRGPLRRDRAGVMLAVLLLLEGLLYAVRLVLILVAGPSSALFADGVPSQVITMTSTVMVAGGAVCLAALRAARSEHLRDRARNFDPVTGARTARSFQPRAVSELRAAGEVRRPVALAAITPADLDELRVAFGADAADAALARCAEVTQLLAPPRAVIGRDDADGKALEVLLPGWTEADAEQWAATVRRELLAAPVELPEGRVRLSATVGIATADPHGYQLGAMCDAAREAARGGGAGGGQGQRGDAAESEPDRSR